MRFVCLCVYIYIHRCAWMIVPTWIGLLSIFKRWPTESSKAEGFILLLIWLLKFFKLDKKQSLWEMEWRMVKQFLVPKQWHLQWLKVSVRALLVHIYQAAQVLTFSSCPHQCCKSCVTVISETDLCRLIHQPTSSLCLPLQKWVSLLLSSLFPFSGIEEDIDREIFSLQFRTTHCISG